MGECLGGCPGRIGAHGRDRLARYAGGLDEEQLDRVGPAAALDQRCQLVGEVGRQARRVVRDVERRFPDSQPGDGLRAARRGLKRQRGTRRAAEDHGGTTGDGDDRVDVLELAFDGVVRGVPARPTATAVVVEHREPWGERRRDLDECGMGPAGEGSMYQQHRRTGTAPIDRDHCPVRRDDRLGHGWIRHSASQ